MDQRSPTTSIARAMEHSLLARRLFFALDIAFPWQRIQLTHPYWNWIQVCPV